MAIHPIDLQTMYSQMDKVGRQQGAEQQVAASAKDVQHEQNKQDAQQRISTVQTISQNGVENINIKDQTSRRRSFNKDNSDGLKEKDVDSQNVEENDDNYITDPSLGQRIDISG